MDFLKQTLQSPDHLVEGRTTTLISLDDDDSGSIEMKILETGVLKVSRRPHRHHHIAATGGASARTRMSTSTTQHRIVISCGIHGNETAPMEIVNGLIDDIASGNLIVAKNRDILFIIGNPPAAVKESRFVEEDLNHLFSGKHVGRTTQEAKRAALLEQVVEDFFTEGGDGQPSSSRLLQHYDLHTAIRGSEFEQFAVCPYLHPPRRSPKPAQLDFLAQYCGVEAVLLSNQPSGTYSYFTSHHLAADAAFTMELGKVQKFGQNNLAKFRTVTEGLRRLIDGNEIMETPSLQQQQQQQHRRPLQLFSVVEEVIKRTEALFQLHNIHDDTQNFTAYPAGTLLASDQGYEYRTQQDHERIVFPKSSQNVPCGQRAMLVVVPTTTTTTTTRIIQ